MTDESMRPAQLARWAAWVLGAFIAAHLGLEMAFVRGQTTYDRVALAAAAGMTPRFVLGVACVGIPVAILLVDVLRRRNRGGHRNLVAASLLGCTVVFGIVHAGSVGLPHRFVAQATGPAIDAVGVVHATAQVGDADRIVGADGSPWFRMVKAFSNRPVRGAFHSIGAIAAAALAALAAARRHRSGALLGWPGTLYVAVMGGVAIWTVFACVRTANPFAT